MSSSWLWDLNNRSITFKGGKQPCSHVLLLCILYLLCTYCVLCVLCVLTVYLLCTLCTYCVLCVLTVYSVYSEYSVYLLCTLCTYLVLAVYLLCTLCTLCTSVYSVYLLCSPGGDKRCEPRCVDIITVFLPQRRALLASHQTLFYCERGSCSSLPSHRMLVII